MVIMVHEAAHAWSEQLFGSTWGEVASNAPVDPDWIEWERARAADGLPVSDYGESARNIGEDFSEAVSLYAVSRLTGSHDELRAIYPHRFRRLDEYAARSEESPMNVLLNAFRIEWFVEDLLSLNPPWDS